jgi:hypothetical protein
MCIRDSVGSEMCIRDSSYWHWRRWKSDPEHVKRP